MPDALRIKKGRQRMGRPGDGIGFAGTGTVLDQVFIAGTTTLAAFVERQHILLK